jgi:hypothetical protein
MKYSENKSTIEGRGWAPVRGILESLFISNMPDFHWETQRTRKLVCGPKCAFCTIDFVLPSVSNGSGAGWQTERAVARIQ